jgi:hypothetical protein
MRTIRALVLRFSGIARRGWIRWSRDGRNSANPRVDLDVLAGMRFTRLAAVSGLMFALTLHAAPAERQIAVENGTGLEFVRVVPQTVTYRGQKALRLGEAPDANDNGVALVTGTEFQDGTIEVDLAGLPAAGSSEGARGFVRVVRR